jgi:hypothetical protein
MERIQYQHADAKMQMRGWMNAVYGKCGARLFSVARQKKRDAQEVKNAGLPKIAEVCQYSMDRLALGAPKVARGHPPPTIARRRGGFVRGCTSLPCTSGTVRTPCPVNLRTGIRKQNGKWNGIKAKRARSHISSRVWSCTCSNRCLARCGCL